MPAPSAPWQLIRVTGHFRDFAGAELNGTVTFAPTQRAIDYANNIIVLPSTLTATVASGILYGPDAVAGILIPATNDPDITPSGWTYTVTETITGQGSTTSYNVQIPYDAAGATIDITDLVPVAAVPNTSPYALASDITTLTATVAGVSGKAARVLDLKDFAGVVGDGANDDTAGIQLAVNSVTAAGTGVPAVHLRVTPGTYRITSTITINRKAVIFAGTGVGNPTAYTTNPGKGSTFQWGGSSGGYMFQIEDATHCEFSNILFQGNTVSPPAAFVRHYNAGVAAQGTNTRIRYHMCTFGSWPWSNVTTPLGTLCATAGVLIDGTNQNNDKPEFTGCAFYSCGVGIDMPNSQSEWGSIDNCYFVNCLTAGIRTSANVTIKNGLFQLNAARDIIINSTAKVDLYGYWSENAGQCAQLNGQGTLNIYGGMVLFSAAMGTNWIEHNSCGAEGGLGLYGFRVNDAATYTGKKIYVRGASGSTTMGNVTIVGCTGVIASMLDVQAGAAGAGFRVFIRTGDLDYNAILKASAVLTTSYNAQVGGLGFWTAKDQGLLAWSYDPSPASTSQLLGTNGTLRGVKLKLDTACTITNLHLWIGALATAASMSNSYAALYSAAGALLQQSADLSIKWNTSGVGAGTGLQTIPITATAVSAGYVYVCWWGSSSATMPTFLALTTGTGNLNLAAVDYRYFTADTSLTSTAPSTLGTKSFLSQHNWAGVS